MPQPPDKSPWPQQRGGRKCAPLAAGAATLANRSPRKTRVRMPLPTRQQRLAQCVPQAPGLSACPILLRPASGRDHRPVGVSQSCHCRPPSSLKNNGKHRHMQHPRNQEKRLKRRYVSGNLSQCRRGTSCIVATKTARAGRNMERYEIRDPNAGTLVPAGESDHKI